MLAQILFWISVLFGLYVVVLYPALLADVAKRHPLAVDRAPYFPSVSIILAAHNGAAFLQEKLASIAALDYPHRSLEIIVVDDGSTDGTRQILASRKDLQSVIYQEKSGKAVALNRGIAAAKHEILVLTDVRQRLAPDSLRLLMENFADPRIGAASAELQIQAGTSSAEGNIGAYWKYERWVRLNLSRIDSIFGATGAYYAIRRNLAVPVPANTLLDDMYLPLHAFFQGYRLIVDPRAKMFDYPTGLATEFGRKVRTLAGNYQILRAYPQLLGSQNRLWIHYVSYKFARLMLPFALLTAVLASLLAGGVLFWVSTIGQVIVYSAALLDPKIPEGTLWKRLSSPIRTSLVMMIAAFCAISIWFIPPDRLWRTTRISRHDIAA